MSDEFAFEDVTPAKGAPQTAGGFEFDDVAPPSGVTSSFFKGANEAITAMAVYAPENAVMSALETVGLVKEGSPRRVTDWMNETFGLGTADSSSTVDRIAKSAGSMVVQNLATIAPVYAASNIAMGFTQGATKQGIARVMNPTLLEGIKQQVIGYIQKAPLVSGVAETVAAAGGGAGAEAAKEAGAGPLGQFIAGVSGAVAPGVTVAVGGKMPTALAIKAIAKGKSYFGAAARTERAFKGVHGELLAGMDAEGEKNLQAANEALGRLDAARAAIDKPGVGSLTVAESTGAPNLLAAQREFESAATGSVLNAYSRRKTRLADNVLLGNAHKPEFTGIEPDVIYDVARARVARTSAALDAKVTAIQQQKEGVVGALPRATDRVDLGARLRTIREDSREQATTVFKERATQIGLNDYDTQFPMADLRVQLRAAMNLKGTKFVEGDLPPSIKDLVTLPSAKPPPGTRPGPSIVGPDGKLIREVVDDSAKPLAWADVELLRKRLADDMEKAVATPGEGRYVRQLAIAKELFDDHMLSINPTGPMSRPTFGQDWQSFRNDYYNQIVTRFDQGAAYKTSAAGKTSEYRMLPEKIADAFWSSESTVREFKRLYGDRPDAMIALRDAVMDKVRDAAVRNGEVNPTLLEGWLRKSARQLDEVPAIRDELRNTQSRLSALSAREAQLVARRAVVEKMALTKALGGPPDAYVRKAIHDARLMRYVANTARRTKSERALKSAVWDEAYRQIDTPEGQLPDTEKLLQWTHDNAASLKIALPKDHLQAISDIHTVLGAVRRTPLPKGQVSTVGALGKIEEVTGSTIGQAASRYYGIKSGRTSERVVLLERGMALFDRYTRRQKDALMQEAIMDENLARQIRDMALSAANGKETAAQTRRLNGWLFTLGVATATSDLE